MWRACPSTPTSAKTRRRRCRVGSASAAAFRRRSVRARPRRDKRACNPSRRSYSDHNRASPRPSADRPACIWPASLAAGEFQFRDRIRDQYRYFTVDEYQDVSPLQQRLLDLWVGKRNDICVVGDPAQTIYSFAGAKAKYLEEFPHKYPNAAIFRLNRNYRSSFEIVDFANSLLAQMPSSKSSVGSLFPTRTKNEVVKINSLSNDFEEAKMITQEISQLLENGVEPKNIAVLSRVNAQLELLASQLESENIEFYMQTNERYSLKSRLEPKITLASIHATKGLEWDHVFVLGVSDGYLPFIQAETQDEINEELRLLYVATTRAKENLYLSWAKSRDSDSGERIISRFLNQKNKLNVATDETVYTTISRKNEITKDICTGTWL